jgi:hypothetical protein
MIKNLTLSVDETVLATVRRYAAAEGSSVNRLVRDFLAGIAARHDRAATARARLLELAAESPARLDGARPDRDEIHAR